MIKWIAKKYLQKLYEFWSFQCESLEIAIKKKNLPLIELIKMKEEYDEAWGNKISIANSILLIEQYKQNEKIIKE